MTAPKRKLSATALSTFLDSPKKYYWQYVANLTPILPQVANYDHDIVFGRLWAEFTDRFYKGVSEAENTAQTMTAWLTDTEGWVPEKAREKLTKGLETLMPNYYQTFSPTDGCRAQHDSLCSFGQRELPCDCKGPLSELWMENDRFVAKLDGLSEDRIVHEVKSTSRAQSVSEQLWKVQHSLQVKLYTVLAQANGSCIEFAYKDPPYTLFRGPVEHVSNDQRDTWELELNALADKIYALGEDPNNFPCHPDGCCLTTRFSTSMCRYQVLCDQGMNENSMIFYKTRESQQDKQKGKR